MNNPNNINNNSNTIYHQNNHLSIRAHDPVSMSYDEVLSDLITIHKYLSLYLEKILSTWKDGEGEQEDKINVSRTTSFDIHLSAFSILIPFSL